MTEYFCNGRVRLNIATMLIVYGAAGAFFIGVPWIRPESFPAQGERIALTAPLVLFFGGMACWALLALLNTLAVYRLDDSGITKRLWNGTEEQFHWQELVHVEATRRGAMTLIDFRGRRMMIAPPSYSYRSRDGHDLRSQLDARLAMAREALKTQMIAPQEFRNGIGAGVFACGFMAVVAITLGVCLARLPYDPPAPPAFLIGAPAVGVLIALFFGFLGMRDATRVITLTEAGITDRTLFGSREIPFAAIQSVTTKDVPVKSTTTEWTTITGAGKRIAFSERLPNYDGLIRALKPHISERVHANAPHMIVQERRQDQKQTVIGLLIIGIMCGFGMGGVAVMQMNEAQVSLARQQKLDRDGTQTTGEVIGTTTTGSKTTSYYLQYAFELAGKRYSHFSSVTRNEYDQARIGENVQVTYLPDNPDVCRIAQSIAREKAENQILFGRGLVVFAALLPILLPILGLTQKNRYHPDRKGT